MLGPVIYRQPQHLQNLNIFDDARNGFTGLVNSAEAKYDSAEAKIGSL